VDGRRLTFAVEAWDAAGPVGQGEHERVIVDAARFMARAAERGQG
jgi:predicted thioesterase